MAIPLAERGVSLSGIELSQPMADRLLAKRGDIPVAVGDMATTTVPGEFTLVYVVWNSIGNLRTQAEQVAAFRNAARHLAAGGRFVVELWVPAIRRFPSGQSAVPFHVGEHHVGFDTYDLEKPCLTPAVRIRTATARPGPRMGLRPPACSHCPVRITPSLTARF